MKQQILLFWQSEAEFDEGAIMKFFQIFGGYQEVMHFGPLSGFILLSLAQQDWKMEIGFVVELVVQLQVSAVELKGTKLLKAICGLSLKFVRERSKVAGNGNHAKVNMVHCESQKFRWYFGVCDVVIHSKTQLADEHFKHEVLLLCSAWETATIIRVPCLEKRISHRKARLWWDNSLSKHY